MSKVRMGRPALFPGKDMKRFIKGHVSPVGTKAFEAARARLAKLSGWKVKDVSDGDTIEFLSRGEAETVAYFEAIYRERTGKEA